MEVSSRPARGTVPGPSQPWLRPAPPDDASVERETGDPLREAWPRDSGTHLLVTHGARHAASLTRVVRGLTARFGQGVVVAADRPATVLRGWFAAAGVREHALRYLDCVSLAAGLPLPTDGRIVPIQSPGLLELVALRADQWLDRLHPRRFLVVDSLSALAVHNGVPPTAEFAQDLAERLRRLRVPAALLVVDGQAPGLLEAARDHADAVTLL